MAASPIALPSVGFPTKIHVVPRTTGGFTQSPFSRAQQFQAFAGNLWEWELEFAPMNSSVGRAWDGFFSSLKGPEACFIIGNPANAAPLGEARLSAGNPVVDGAGQTGFDLDISTTGLGSVDGYLLRGDWLSIGSDLTRRLHVVTADVDLVADVATVPIWPQLRYSPDNLAPVDLTDASGLFRLATRYGGAAYDAAHNVNIGTVSIVELLEV